MSFKGIYAALSGAMAQTQKIDTIANNIANVNTTGFKKDTQTFKEYLTAFEKEPNVNTVPREPASMEHIYNMNGSDKSFVDSAGTYTNFEQGSLKRTGGKLDVAIDGEGFFEVQSGGSTKLTRAGNFTIDGNGQLVTKDGAAVLLESNGEEGAEGRTIQFSGQKQAYISDGGEVFDGEQKLGRISLVKVANPESLQKVGSNYYEYKPNMNPEISKVNFPNLKQGYLETSNVNVIQEMTDMIMAQRVFEGTQKAMQAYDQMEDKAVNQVGNTRG